MSRLASMQEATEWAMPARMAWAISACVVAIDTPFSAARASGCICGTRRPVSAGMNVTPPDEGTVAASALICRASWNQCSLLQTQLSAEPVVATKVSTE
ncbi:hypothetical protein D3C85_1260820 [compost metagenome]